MKPVRDWTREDLVALIGQEEGSSLEFKASGALDPADGKNRKELVKDVTAMANAAGGRIIYGIVEQKTGIAEHIDDGTDTPPEWIEQVLDSNAEPKVAGYLVHRIPLGNGRHAIVIDVPQATVHAPHQSKPHEKYYRRYGRTSQPMLDYEIRDLMRRATAPELFLRFKLWKVGGNSTAHRLSVSIGNQSNTPALYGRVIVSFDEALETPPVYPGFEVNSTSLKFRGGEVQGTAYVKNFAAPTDLPVFKEQVMRWFDTSMLVKTHKFYPISYRLACPGFVKLARGAIVRHEGDAQLIWEGEVGYPA